MRMVDLRPSDDAAATPPALTVLVSEAAEVLRLIGVLNDDEDAESYDLGVERLDHLRDLIGPAAIERLRAHDGSAKTFHVLALIAPDLPGPADLAALRLQLETDPASTWRALLGHHTSRSPGRGGAELGDRVADGEPDALATVRDWADDDTCPAAVRTLLEVAPEDHGAFVLDALDAVRPAWEAIATEAMGAIERDADYRVAQHKDGTPVQDIVLEATNGYALPTDIALTGTVIIPSYVLRPWIVIGRHAAVEVISSVVADQFVGLPSEAPSPALLKLFKALSDEGRLRLLRRMTDGPISLTEACQELDVAKATAHHHLSILRQAGLVMMLGEGRGKRYALRDNPPDAAHDALAAYVQPGRH